METSTIILVLCTVLLLICGSTFLGLFVWQITQEKPTCPLCKTCLACPACTGLPVIDMTQSRYVPANGDRPGSGGGVERLFVNTATVEACATRCEDDPACKGVSYNTNTKQCYTKTGTYPMPAWIYYEKTPKKLN